MTLIRDYGFEALTDKEIGVFQVKRHFKEPALMELIERSAKELAGWIEENSFTGRVFLNFPGIGYGKLKDREREIREVLSVLPDNVWVWKKVEGIDISVDPHEDTENTLSI
ncbi:hypothetical protein [Hydrogenivirga sp.]